MNDVRSDVHKDLNVTVALSTFVLLPQYGGNAKVEKEWKSSVAVDQDDYILAHEDLFAGCVGLEMGAGTGFAGLILGRIARARMWPWQAR
ncbi:hypothetical protein WJX75_001983 [Coccomyxa subellipsoidea]|uniref:Uncharacterized protein n=1 Tax=Coccomyxa subellipsoidea TaxID=248742 RepID=A0ABR2YJZ2_9CHLO